MTNSYVDILYITHNRPRYTKKSLPALLRACDDKTRVWIWHNGSDSETQSIVESYLKDPHIYRYQYSRENVGLSQPQNWIWSHSDAWLIGKVDDDILVTREFILTLKEYHHINPRFGVLSAWNYGPDDFDPTLAQKKIIRFGHKDLLQHSWVGGGSYLMKRQCVRSAGLLPEGASFPKYCTKLAWRGWINGWPVPLVLADHMDDPCSPEFPYSCDEEFVAASSLTVKKNNIHTIAEWRRLIQEAALYVQSGRRVPGRLYLLRSFPARIARIMCGY